MEVKLSKEQVEAVLQILNRTQFSGADAEFVTSLKRVFGNALESEKSVPENK